MEVKIEILLTGLHGAHGAGLASHWQVELRHEWHVLKLKLKKWWSTKKKKITSQYGVENSGLGLGPDLGSITFKCNRLNYNHFVNVIDYITDYI